LEKNSQSIAIFVFVNLIAFGFSFIVRPTGGGIPDIVPLSILTD